MNGRIENPNVDPEFIGQILASYRGNNAQMRRILRDLQILRERKVWGEAEWDQVYRLHREMDAIRGRMEALRAQLHAAGVTVT